MLNLHRNLYKFKNFEHVCTRLALAYRLMFCLFSSLMKTARWISFFLRSLLGKNGRSGIHGHCFKINVLVLS